MFDQWHILARRWQLESEEAQVPLLDHNGFNAFRAFESSKVNASSDRISLHIFIGKWRQHLLQILLTGAWEQP